jgi:hypothetical protein
MKLSEAIRLGSMMKPQAFGATRDGDGSCALGTALDAVGMTAAHYTDVMREWPHTMDIVSNPVHGRQMMLMSAIRELNDCERWTRERIADFVESIEAQSETPTTVEVEHAEI